MKNKSFFAFLCFFAGVIFTLDVNADTKLNLTCDDEVKPLSNLKCDVSLESDIDVTEVSFSILSDFDTNVDSTLVNATTYILEKNQALHKISVNDTDFIDNGKILDFSITVPSNYSTDYGIVRLVNVLVNSNVSVNEVSNRVTVLRDKSNDSSLKSISVAGNEISGFSKDKKEYNVNVDELSFSVAAVASDSKAQVVIEGGEKQSITYSGKKDITIEVTAEDTTVTKYVLKVTHIPQKSSDNTLKELELFANDKKIEFDFESNKYEYTINVNSDIDKVSIKSTLNDERAKYVKNYEDRTAKINYGNNKVEIRVIAENEKTQSYVLNIIREDNRNNDATLSGLIVNDVPVKLTSGIYEYRVDVRYIYERSDISVTKNSELSLVSYVDIPLIEGVNEPIIITVTSEKGDTKTYKIVINKLSESESKVLLKNISIIGHDEFVFNPNVTNYTLKIDSDTTKLDFLITPSLNLGYDVIETVISGNTNLVDNSTIIVRVKDDSGIHSYEFVTKKNGETLLGIPFDILSYSIFGIGVISFISSIMYVSLKKKKYNNIVNSNI